MECASTYTTLPCSTSEKLPAPARHNNIRLDNEMIWYLDTTDAAGPDRATGSAVQSKHKH
ncbi:hypothetical protein HYALB_00011724 [Hymenoscyphus albidus]|uniref:Uncharacterized protein n=1 Tax=Hymenoscyphus albidus TaxID=595503 RepID=A0A9N9LS40_9HELO|nr:hypothetical protein HYALB_00011724 [Hymenoscyphus albidus]